jgi:hypothetical protein
VRWLLIFLLHLRDCARLTSLDTLQSHSQQPPFAPPPTCLASHCFAPQLPPERGGANTHHRRRQRFAVGHRCSAKLQLKRNGGEPARPLPSDSRRVGCPATLARPYSAGHPRHSILSSRSSLSPRPVPRRTALRRCCCHRQRQQFCT